MAKEEQVIRTTDRVKIIALKGAKHMTEGQEYNVHPNQAERFVKAGWAKLAEEESKPSKKK